MMKWNYCNEDCEYLSKNNKCIADGRIFSTTINVHGLLDVSTSHKHVAGCVKDRKTEKIRLIDANILIENIWKKHKEAEELSYYSADEVKEMLCEIVSLIDEQPTMESERRDEKRDNKTPEPVVDFIRSRFMTRQ